MSKKTPVKKSKRRLKRSVRRSLAAVLMITAIGVAAVPVPENAAAPEGGAEEGIMPYAATDLHKLYSYVSESDTENYKKENDENLSGDITLYTYKDTTTSELIGKLAQPGDPATAGKLYQSLNITRQGNDWMLRWEFIYYLAMHPIENNLQGVICRYNDSYSAEEVGLTLNPNTEYYTVSETTFNDYFMTPSPSSGEEDSDGTSSSDTTAREKAHQDAMKSEQMNDVTDPMKEMVFTYDQWSGDEILDDASRAIQECLKKYFKTDWEDFEKSCNAYPAAKDAWDKADPDTRGDAPQKPVLKLTPATRLLETNPNLRYSYFCEYSRKLAAYGKDLELVRVQDGTNRESSSTSRYIYVVHSEKPEEIEAQYPDAKFDKNGFLVTATGRPVCAIGDKAFSKVANVDVLTLPSQIGYIGNEAFQDSFIKEIEISSVEFIGNRAFQRCPELSKVTIGNGTKVIGAECFESTPITTLSLPYSVSAIGYGAFANCKSLATLNLNNISTACVVKEAAFYNCSGLTSVQMDASNIRSLGDAAFAVGSGSNELNIVLPPNIEAKYTYQNGGSSKTINGLGDYLFAGRTSLRSVVFPKEYGRSEVGAVNVPDNMFHACANLQYVEFPADWKTDQYVGGYVSYGEKDPEDNKYILFADVLTENFYVKGPEYKQSGTVADPRRSTWSSKSGRADNNTVPYVYTDSSGTEFYEVSDGDYLLCVNKDGVLISCKLAAEETRDSGPLPSTVELVIPSKVGTINVKSIATGCFSDELAKRVVSLEIEDNSLTEIGAAVFQGTNSEDTHPDRWQNLKSVEIGNSVASIGANAFENCKSLQDVTFHSPAVGHAAFKIGTDAFKTGSGFLVFHGDIADGYAPFDWAMTPSNTIDKDGIRVCYQSLAPTYLTVMYDAGTGMVTLLDYPKYDDIDEILAKLHADEIPAGQTYAQMMANRYYALYAGPEFNGYRQNFADAWHKAETMDDAEALYDDPILYGPWINESFRLEDYPLTSSGDPTVSGNTSSHSLLDAAADFFLEPIVAYAIESEPKPFYDKFPYSAQNNADSDNPYLSLTDDERELVKATQEIVVPAGVDSIDVAGFLNGSNANGLNAARYLLPTSSYQSSVKLSTNSYRMYQSILAAGDDESDTTALVPGLFSGYYKDYKTSAEASIYENHGRGNDRIKSITMNSVKYLPDYAFDSCERLETVILGPDCADIGTAPFRGCYSLTSVSNNEYYTTENGIVYYTKNTDGSYTIEECLPARGRQGMVGEPVVDASNDGNLEKVSMIKPGAFEECDYITTVDLRNTAGLTRIPEDCFRNCDNLQRVWLSRDVSYIDSGAFAYDTVLSDITIYGKEVFIAADAFENVKKSPTTIYTYEDSAAKSYVERYGADYPSGYTLNWSKLGDQWRVIFLDIDGKQIGDTVFVDDGSVLTNAQRPTPPEHEGYAFNGWLGTNNMDIGDAITEDTIFIAQYRSTQGMVDGKYVVEFYDGVDGKLIDTRYADPGAEVTPPNPPVHAGYTFLQWSDSLTNIQANKTVLALYSGGGNGGGTTPGGTTPGGGAATGSSGSTTTGSKGSTTTGSSGSTTTSGSSTSATSTTAAAYGLYTLTVINGSGSGTYAAGTTVIITANPPATGQVFNKWTTDSEGITFTSVSLSTTTLTMPAANAAVTAEFVSGSGATPVSAVGGNGGGNGITTVGTNGGTRVDITKPGISNKDLATANVNGSTDNFIVKISETPEATQAVANALTNKYGNLENILYYAMDISLYDSTGTTRIPDITGLTVDITIPIPDALVAYGGNNMAGAVVSNQIATDQMEDLGVRFSTINGVPCISFTATHFSPYTIYVDTSNLTAGMLDVTPKTGDPIHPKWFLSLGLACLSVILFIKKDKKVALQNV